MQDTNQKRKKSRVDTDTNSEPVNPEHVATHMTANWLSAAPETSAAEALKQIRQLNNPYDLHDVYLCDNKQLLCGKVSLNTLIRADKNTQLAQLSQATLLSVGASDDKERIAQLFRQQPSLLSLPVVDDQGHMIGLIKHSDALAILVDEDQEDMDRIMGVVGSGSSLTYRELSVGDHIRNRLGWLVGLALLGFVSGSILMRYESALDELVILAIYLPMLADTGGNAGGQSASIIIRALALGELRLSDLWRVLYKELIIALGLAAVLVLIASMRIWLLTPEHHVPAELSLDRIMLCIGLALAIQVLSSNLIGAALPLAVHACGRDPAVIASPAITTIVDISGLLIYFSLASALLL
ncbi:magnesium transporter [Agaribacterium haliotis]|uniref:magnesium transporter n=1 Tax=Agaribacterium haliotis TaxID=2013869 RepID=UPI000BB585A7|nr:magnesium transporter [Agaribacterium haliotis]